MTQAEAVLLYTAGEWVGEYLTMSAVTPLCTVDGEVRRVSQPSK